MRVSVRVGDHSVEVGTGCNLLDVCHEHDLPIEFSCRGGSCGTCLVRVLEGAENLSPHTDPESVLLPDLVEDPSEYRLACQSVVHGSVRIVWVDRSGAP